MSLIQKYNIKEEDLYKLSCIENTKKNSSFFQKEKLKAKSLAILKPYNIKFMDLGNLINQIAKNELYSDEKLVEKFGKYEIDDQKSSYGFKYTVPIGVGLGIFIMILILFPSGPSTCDCIDRMTDAALYGDSYETKYLKCLDKYYDEAFDYIEENDPNGKYANYDDVIVSYWLIKCEESKSKENKEKATIPTNSEDIIIDDEDYEDMYSEEDYEEEPEEENIDGYYNDSQSTGYVNVENLNFRSTPNIQENNIIGKLYNGQQVVIVNTIESKTDSPKGLLKKETILEYKGNELKLQPGKAVDIIEPLEELDSNGRIIRILYKCKAILNSNESIAFNIDADFLELISTEDWSQIKIEDGTIGYVYSRFLTQEISDEEEIYDYYEVYNTYLDKEDYLNLRSEATSKSTNITRMTDGTKLILLSKGNGSNGKWMKVRVLESGEVGYAHTKWIRKINEE